MSTKTRQIEFGKHYDLPLRGKIFMTLHYLLAVLVAPLFLVVMAVLLTLIMIVFVAVSPIVILGMSVVEIWLPPINDSIEKPE